MEREYKVQTRFLFHTNIKIKIPKILTLTYSNSLIIYIIFIKIFYQIKIKF